MLRSHFFRSFIFEIIVLETFIPANDSVLQAIKVYTDSSPIFYFCEIVYHAVAFAFEIKINIWILKEIS